MAGGRFKSLCAWGLSESPRGALFIHACSLGLPPPPLASSSLPATGLLEQHSKHLMGLIESHRLPKTLGGNKAEVKS